MSKGYTGAGGFMTAVLAAAVLSGCAAAGSGRFSCPGRPEGVRCASAVEVYRLTGESDQIAATAGAAIGTDPARAADARAEQQERAAADETAGLATAAPTAPGTIGVSAAGAVSPAPRAERPTPVRTPAQVMRVWLAPWEDTKGVLHVGGYHYIEVVARRWSIGGLIDAEPARVFSINYDDTVLDPAPAPAAIEAAASASGAGAAAPAVFGGISGGVNTTGN